MEKRLLKKNDIILVVGLLVATLALTLVLFTTRSSGDMVEVSVDGQVVATFPLSEDLEYTITGVGGGENYLVIKDGEAFLTDATCPDKLCVHMGHISQVGQSIICLPNKVVVTIVGDKKDEGYDAVVG